MKVFVTGVNGQLCHDVVKEQLRCGYTAIGSGSRAGDSMIVFVTGVGEQLGHDVVNNLISKKHEAVGSDIQAVYSGVNDGSAVVLPLTSKWT